MYRCIDACIHVYKCVHIYIYIYTHNHNRSAASLSVGEGEVLVRGVGTLRYLLILAGNSVCQVPICAVGAVAA